MEQFARSGFIDRMNLFWSKFMISNIVMISSLNLTEAQSSKTDLTVMVFLSTDCPISQSYISTLNRIQVQYTGRVTLVGVFPANCSRKEIFQFINQHNLDFKVELDCNRKIAKKMGATVTPEVFLSNQAGQILYQGAIDNWFYELGRHRASPTENYLTEAIADTLEGNLVKKPRTTPIGCYINKN